MNFVFVSFPGRPQRSVETPRGSTERKPLGSGKRFAWGKNVFGQPIWCFIEAVFSRHVQDG